MRPTAQLRQRVEERREQTQHPPAAPHPPPPAPPPVAVPPPDPAPPPIVAPPRAAPPPPTLAPPPITPPPPPRHRRTRAEWEELIGGNLFNRIGILAVICAMGFFVKFAYDQQWLFRDLLAAVVGLLFLWIGHYFHRRTLHFFGHGLLGGGIALLYISVFAAAILHRLLPAPLALLLMAVVTVGAFLISLRYNAVAVALIGWAGGYLTPVLLQTGQLDDVSQLLFLILLTGGLLAVQSRRNHWAVLEPLALLSNITLYGLWFQSSYTAAHLPLAVCFVVSIWALFLALDLSRLRHAIASYPQLRTAVAVGNAAAFYLGLYLALQAAGATDWLGAVTLAVALVYAGLARRQAAPAAPPAETRYALTAVVLIVLAIYLQFRAQPFLVIGLWAAAALALLWLGAAWRRAYLWGAALSVYTLTFLVLLNLPDVFTYRAISHFNPVMNLRVLAFLALAAALAGGTLAARRLDDGPREPITITFHYAWTLLLLLLITIEVNDIYRQVNGVIGLSVVGDPHASERIVLPVLWAVYSLPLVWLGLRRRLTPLLVIGLAVLTIG
ncbi:MAG TPA: DUF2339 domain-containing protein, partial [Armatimonadota bacterium]|nr:DUF2339 domain-containing protein [Armatimonadota bacterium]